MICTFVLPGCKCLGLVSWRPTTSDNSFHSPTVIPPSALDKPSIMKRYHRRRTCSHTSPLRSPTMVTLQDTRFVECRWWKDGWTVKTGVTLRPSTSMITAPVVLWMGIESSEKLPSTAVIHWIMIRVHVKNPPPEQNVPPCFLCTLPQANEEKKKKKRRRKERQKTTIGNNSNNKSSSSKPSNQSTKQQQSQWKQAVNDKGAEFETGTHLHANNTACLTGWDTRSLALWC